MSLMEGKRGIIFGVANDRSYAWHITKSLMEHGAECLFTHLPGDKMERRCVGAVKELGIDNPWLMPCDVSRDEDLDAVFNKLGADFGSIDFVVHSVAFADRAFLDVGKFHTTSRQAWTQALDISAYSLLAMAQRAKAIMPQGGSIISMTYYGGEKVIPGYNVMGIAKAALEHTTRYLASELGEQNIRVNTISGGPLRFPSPQHRRRRSGQYGCLSAQRPVQCRHRGDDSRGCGFQHHRPMKKPAQAST